MTRPVRIVLGAPADAIGIGVDLATGRRGWSHVALDVGLGGFGDDRLLVDIDRTLGVVLQRFSVVFPDARATLELEIPQRWNSYVRRRIIDRIGEPYSLLAMALQPLQLDGVPGAYCSRVIAEALPECMRKMLPRCPAPADFVALQVGGACV